MRYLIYPLNMDILVSFDILTSFRGNIHKEMKIYTRWFKYDRD